MSKLLLLVFCNKQKKIYLGLLFIRFYFLPQKFPPFSICFHFPRHATIKAPIKLGQLHCIKIMVNYKMLIFYPSMGLPTCCSTAEMLPCRATAEHTLLFNSSGQISIWITFKFSLNRGGLKTDIFSAYHQKRKWGYIYFPKCSCQFKRAPSSNITSACNNALQKIMIKFVSCQKLLFKFLWVDYYFCNKRYRMQ